jgi:hypothetical protein
MLKKDYLVRQFEEFGKVFATILGFKKSRDWEKLEKEIYLAAQKFTSYEIDYVERLSTEEYQREILSHQRLTSEQHKILADLLFEKMHFYLMMDDMEKYGILKLKCIMLYEFISGDLTQNQFNLDVHYKLDYLRNIS